MFGDLAKINPFKGLDLLPEDVRKQIIIHVQGENTHYRDTEFYLRTETLLQEVRDVVSLMGAYRGDHVINLMAACDCVAPSV
jgi:hypothetical protein